MKKLLLIMTLIGMTCLLSAQTKYMRMETYTKSEKVQNEKRLVYYARIDTGAYAILPAHIVDEKGNKKFNSPIDAINYVAKDGWELISVVSKPAGMSNTYSGIAYIYFLERKEE